MKTKTTLKFFIVAMLLSLHVTKTDAQIVYTDIDPDTTIYLPKVPWNYDSAHHYHLDLNGNDTIDFNITIRHYYYYSLGHNYGERLYIVQETDGLVYGACAPGGVREDISTNDTINSDLSWYSIKYLFYEIKCSLIL